MNKIYIYTSILVLGLFAAMLPAQAQDHIAVTSRDLPQSMLINPAMRPERSFMSIPFIGSFGAGFNNSFSYNDVISRNCAGQQYLDTKRLVDAISGRDLTMLRMNIDLVNTGFFVTPKDYIGVSLRARMHGATSLPEGLFEAVLDNPINKYKTFDISATPNAIGWAELGVSYTRDINSNWRVGGRVKYLAGVASLQSSGIDVTMQKEYDRYLLSGDYSLRGGNLNFGNGSSDDILNNIGRNPGVAVDLGATYVTPDKRWNVGFSVTDLGAIFWNSANSSIIKTHSGGNKYEYYGFDNISQLINGSTSIGNALDSAMTDFSRVLGADTTSGGFTQMLPTSFQAAATFSIDSYRRHNVSAGFMGMLPYQGKMYYSVSAGYAYRSINGIWQLMVNYTYKTNNPLNIGLGVVMTTGVFQLYLSTDNIIPAFDLSQARSSDVNLGLNFFFNKKSHKEGRQMNKYYR